MELESRKQKIEFAKKKLNRFRNHGNNVTPPTSSVGDSRRINQSKLSEGTESSFETPKAAATVQLNSCDSESSSPYHCQVEAIKKFGASLIPDDKLVGEYGDLYEGEIAGNTTSASALSKLRQSLGLLQQTIDGALLGQQLTSPSNEDYSEPDGSTSQTVPLQQLFHILEKDVAHSREVLTQRAQENRPDAHFIMMSSSDNLPENGPAASYEIFSEFQPVESVQMLLAAKDGTIRELTLQVRHLQEANHSLYLENSNQEQFLCQEVDALSEKLTLAREALQAVQQSNSQLASQVRRQRAQQTQETNEWQQRVDKLTKEREAIEKAFQEKISSIEQERKMEKEKQFGEILRLQEELRKACLERENMRDGLQRQDRSTRGVTVAVQCEEEDYTKTQLVAELLTAKETILAQELQLMQLKEENQTMNTYHSSIQKETEHQLQEKLRHLETQTAHHMEALQIVIEKSQAELLTTKETILAQELQLVQLKEENQTMNTCHNTILEETERQWQGKLRNLENQTAQNMEEVRMAMEKSQSELLAAQEAILAQGLQLMQLKEENQTMKTSHKSILEETERQWQEKLYNLESQTAQDIEELRRVMEKSQTELLTAKETILAQELEQMQLKEENQTMNTSHNTILEETERQWQGKLRNLENQTAQDIEELRRVIEKSHAKLLTAKETIFAQELQLMQLKEENQTMNTSHNSILGECERQWQEKLCNLENQAAQNMEELRMAMEKSQAELIYAKETILAQELQMMQLKEENQTIKTSHNSILEETERQWQGKLRNLENQTAQGIEELRRVMEKSQTELLAAKEVILAQELQLMQLKEENQTMNTSHNSILGECERQWQEKLHHLETQAAHDLEELRMATKKSEINFKALKIRHKALQLENSTLRNHLEESLSKDRAVSDENATLKADLQSLALEKSSFVDKIRSLTSENYAVRFEVRNLLAIMTDAKEASASDDVCVTLSALHEAVVKSQEDRKQLEEQVSSLDEQRSSLKKANNELASRLHTAESNHQHVLLSASQQQKAQRAETLQLRRSLADVGEESRNFDERVCHLLEELAHSKDTLAQLVAERDELQRRYTERSADAKRQWEWERGQLREELERNHEDCLTRRQALQILTDSLQSSDSPLSEILSTYVSMEAAVIRLHQTNVQEAAQLLPLAQTPSDVATLTEISSLNEQPESISALLDRFNHLLNLMWEMILRFLRLPPPPSAVEVERLQQQSVKAAKDQRCLAKAKVKLVKLRDQLVSKESEVSQLIGQLQSTTETLSTMENAMKVDHETIANLEEKLSNVQEGLNISEGQVQEKTKEIERLQEFQKSKLCEFAAREAQMSQKLDEVQRNWNTTQHQLQQARDEMLHLQKEYTELAAREAQLQVQYEAAKIDAMQEQSLLQNRLDEIANLQLLCASQQEQMESLQNEMSSAVARESHLRRELEEAKCEARQSQLLLQQQRGELESVQHLCHKLDDAIGEVSAHQDMNHIITHATATIQSLRQNVTELSSREVQLAKELDAAKCSATRNENALQQKIDDIEAMQEVELELKEQLSCLQEQCMALATQLEETTKRSVMAEAQLKEHFNVNILNKDATLAKLQEENDVLINTNSQLSTELAAIKTETLLWETKVLELSKELTTAQETLVTREEILCGVLAEKQALQEQLECAQCTYVTRESQWQAQLDHMAHVSQENETSCRQSQVELSVLQQELQTVQEHCSLLGAEKGQLLEALQRTMLHESSLLEENADLHSRIMRLEDNLRECDQRMNSLCDAVEHFREVEEQRDRDSEAREKELLDLKHEKLSILDRCSSLQQDRDTIAKKVVRLREKLYQFHLREAALKEELEERKEISNRETVQLHERTLRLELQLDVCVDRVNTLHNDVDTLRNARERVKQKLQTCKQQLRDVIEEKTILTEKLKNVQESCSSLSSENCQLKRDLQKAEQSSIQSHEELQRTTMRAVSLQDELEKTVKEAACVNEKIARLEITFQECGLRMDQLHGNVETLQHLGEDRRLKLAACENELCEMTRVKDCLQHQIQQSRLKECELTETVASLSSSLSRQHEETETLRKELQEAKHQGSLSQMEASQLIVQLEARTNEAATLKSNIAAFEAQLKESQLLEMGLKQELDILRIDLVKKTAFLEAKEEQMISLQQQVSKKEDECYQRRERVEVLEEQICSYKRLQDEVVRLQGDLQVAQDSREHAETQLSHKRERISQLKAQVLLQENTLRQQYSTEIDELKASLQQLREEVRHSSLQFTQQHDQEVNDLRTQLREAQHNADMAQVQVQDLTLRETHLKEELQVVQGQLAMEKLEMQEKDTELETLRKEVSQGQTVIENYHNELSVLLEALSRVHSQLTKVQHEVRLRESFLLAINEALMQKDSAINDLLTEKALREGVDRSMELALLQSEVQRLQDEVSKRGLREEQYHAKEEYLVEVVKTVSKDARIELCPNEMSVEQLAAQVLLQQTERLRELTSLVTRCEMKLQLCQQLDSAGSLESLVLQLLEKLTQQNAQVRQLEMKVAAAEEKPLRNSLCLPRPASKHSSSVHSVSGVEMTTVSRCKSLEALYQSNLATFLNEWEQAFETTSELPLEEETLLEEEVLKLHQQKQQQVSSAQKSESVDLGHTCEELMQHLLVLPHCEDFLKPENIPNIQRTLQILNEVLVNCADQVDSLTKALARIVVHYLTEKLDQAGHRVDLLSWGSDVEDPMWPHLRQFVAHVQTECARFLPLPHDLEHEPVVPPPSSRAMLTILCRNLDLAVGALCELKAKLERRFLCAKVCKTAESEQQHTAGNESQAVQSVTEPPASADDALWEEICSTTDVEDLQEFCFMVSKTNGDLQSQLNTSTALNQQLFEQWRHVSQQMNRVNCLVDQATRSMADIEMSLLPQLSPALPTSAPSSSPSKMRHLRLFASAKANPPSRNLRCVTGMDDSALGDSCVSSPPRRRHHSEHSYLESHCSNNSIPHEQVEPAGSIDSSEYLASNYETASSVSPVDLDEECLTQDSEGSEPLQELSTVSPLELDIPNSPTAAPPLSACNLISAIEEHRCAVLELRSLLQDLQGPWDSHN